MSICHHGVDVWVAVVVRIMLACFVARLFLSPGWRMKHCPRFSLIMAYIQQPIELHLNAGRDRGTKFLGHECKFWRRWQKNSLPSFFFFPIFHHLTFVSFLSLIFFQFIFPSSLLFHASERRVSQFWLSLGAASLWSSDSLSLLEPPSSLGLAPPKIFCCCSESATALTGSLTVRGRSFSRGRAAASSGNGERKNKLLKLVMKHNHYDISNTCNKCNKYILGFIFMSNKA